MINPAFFLCDRSAFSPCVSKAGRTNGYFSCNSSAFRLHCHKSMHTGCVSRSLAPAGLGIPLQKQRDTSRDSGGLNCNLFFIIIQFFSFLHAFLIQCNASLSQKHACGPQFGSLCAFSQKMLQSFYIFRIGDTCKI